MRQLTRLIDNGVDANVRDYDQRTALHIAARRGLLTVVEYLISLKAEINVVDRWAHCRLVQLHAGGDKGVSGGRFPGSCKSAGSAELICIPRRVQLHARAEQRAVRSNQLRLSDQLKPNLHGDPGFSPAEAYSHKAALPESAMTASRCGGNQPKLCGCACCLTEQLCCPS